MTRIVRTAFVLTFTAIAMLGNHSLSSCIRMLRAGGIYVINGGPISRTFMAFLLSRFGLKKRVAFFLAAVKQSDLNALKDLIEATKVTPIIDRHYALSDVSEAMRYLEEGHARGKIVITP